MLSPGAASLLVAVVALLFATGGTAIKAAEMGPWQVATLRSLVAFVVLFCLSGAVRQRWSAAVFLLGVPYAAVMILFVHANGLASAGSVTLLQATAPLWVLLLSPWVLGERVDWRRLLPLPCFALGLLVILSDAQRPTALATDPALGRWLAAAAGFSFALVVLGLSSLQRGRASTPKANSDGSRGAGDRVALQSVACGNLLAALVAVPFAVWMWQPIGPLDWGVSAYLGCFQIALPYLLLLPAMRTVPAFEVSLLLLLEPLASPLFAFWVHGEELSSRVAAGGAMIVIGCVLQAIVMRSREGR